MNEPPSPSTLSTRRLNQLKEQASYLRYRILDLFRQGEYTCWQDIEAKGGLKLETLLPAGTNITAAFRAARPIQFQLDQLLKRYVDDTEKRVALAEQAEPVAQTKLVLADESQCYRFKNGQSIKALLPEQHPVFEKIYDILFNNKNPDPSQPIPRALLQNGATGSGKTVIADALVDRFIAEDRHLPNPSFPIPIPYPILWVTVPNAKEQTRRSLESCGLGDYLDTIIHVIGYSELSTELGQAKFCRVEWEEDPFGELPPKKVYKWIPASVCKFLILDEAHSIQSEDSIRTEIIKALDLTERQLTLPDFANPNNPPKSMFNMRILFMTATPVERVSDMKMFTCMTNIDYLGTRITYDNFRTAFANVIANGYPDEVNREATKRLWKVMQHRVIELPRIKWKHKAINSVRIYQFRTEEDRQTYRQAWQRHVERCQLLGKDADAGAEYTSLMIFAKEVEPIRARQVVEEMYANVQEGRTSIMATRFTGTIIKGVFTLMDEFNVTRDQISIIWGGRQNIKPERILTQDDIQDIMQDAIAAGGVISADVKRLIRRNLQWQEDRLLFGDPSDAGQAARYNRLQSLGLIGIQTREKRQAEIDKFMSGQARYCFFTAQSGGTGLSLEHASDKTAQRYVWTTPIYSSKEFTQMMGRAPRRISWSDSIQKICLMDGTVESEHVAPILDKKLQSAGEFSSSKTDLAMVLAGERIRTSEFKDARQLASVLRTQEQVLADSDRDETQLYAPDAFADSDDNDSSND